MNLSSQGYVTRQSDPYRAQPESTVAEDIKAHHEILSRSGKFTPTGTVALISDPDPSYPGALQVWSKTAEGMWVWVNPEGVVMESACPIGD